MHRHARKRGQWARLVLVLLTAATMQGQHRGARGAVPPPPNNSPVFKDVLVTFQGVLKSLNKKEIIVELDENRQLLTFRRTKETKFTEGSLEVKAAALDLESHVTVEAKEDTDSKFKAVTVRKAGVKPESN